MPEGTSKPYNSVWRHFGAALDRYRHSWMQQQEPHYLGLKPIRPHGWNACPCMLL
jgi:hypothetical protein